MSRMSTSQNVHGTRKIVARTYDHDETMFTSIIFKADDYTHFDLTVFDVTPNQLIAALAVAENLDEVDDET